MRIIITYACAGAGHLKIAEAIHQYLREQYKDIEVKLIDILKESNLFFRISYIYGYDFLIRYLLWLWAFAFWITYLKALRLFTRAIVSFINRLNTKNFARLLVQENPDFIISTHFLPSEIIAYLKNRQKLGAKLITVITDFGVHPFWISKATDIYVVASDFTKEQLIEEGVREADIRVLGIPIDMKFSKVYEREVLFEKFHLDKTKFTVLIATGSFGIGPIEEIIDALYQEVQILVVCARNQRLYTRLKRKKYPSVRVFGFIENIQELMAISQMIITKPGGASIAESLSMDLFPIFIAPIPGQETENIKALSIYNIGIQGKDTHFIKDIVLDFKNYPEQLECIKENIHKLKKPFAAKELGDAICQGSIWPAS